MYSCIENPVVDSSADNATVSLCCFSVIGAAIIVLGLYALIWGKSKDEVNQVADVSASGGSKGGAAAGGELPITLAQSNGNGKHELGSGRGVVFDVETPVANGHYELASSTPKTSNLPVSSS